MELISSGITYEPWSRYSKQHGIVGDNKELLKSCGSEDMDADDASSAIVKFLWLKLRHEK